MVLMTYPQHNELRLVGLRVYDGETYVNGKGFTLDGDTSYDEQLLCF